MRIVRTYPEQIVREALSLTKDQAAHGRIRKSHGAYFTDTVRRLAEKRGPIPTRVALRSVADRGFTATVHAAFRRILDPRAQRMSRPALCVPPSLISNDHFHATI